MTDRIPGKRQEPQLDGLGFDHRLLTPERLLALAGGARLRLSQEDPGWLDCAECGKGVEQLADGAGGRYEFTAQQFLANLLRHLVMSHDVSLSGGR